MRKICLAALSLLIFFFSFNTSFPQSNVAAAQEISPTPKVNYELPYPGLLPDSPIYFLRAIRDKTVGFLISDPKKKAEFDLLQADKRLNAGIYLFSKGKISISISTISKAENYFEQAIQKIKEAKKQGMDIKDMERKLRTSVKKHQEELGKLISKVNKDFKGSFEKEYKRVVEFEERLKR